ncbi:MAG: beta-aspartyl-peptidase (threonine type) [Paraglaciecola sp.]
MAKWFLQTILPLKRPIYYIITKFIKTMTNLIKASILLLSAISLLSCNPQQTENANNEKIKPPTEQNRAAYSIVIHGGAGVILKKNMTEEKEKYYLNALNAALDKGESILKDGGTAADAVEQTIMILENHPGFNAGKGAVFTHDGTNKMDASFMDGKTQNAGAVGEISTVKNPIRAARLVMDKSDHVLLTGEGANSFAIENGLDTVPTSYFYTEQRWESLQKVLQEENKQEGYIHPPADHKFGTVGCVALDKDGNLAAGTSTGGMTNKRWGRLGDSPIIAAGTYANNQTCGVSCTGHGEFFIRYAVAYDVSARMEYLGEDLATATDFIINKKLVEKGGSGGLIAMDKYGNVAMPFNTDGMFRGYVKDGKRKVLIYK